MPTPEHSTDPKSYRRRLRIATQRTLDDLRQQTGWSHTHNEQHAASVAEAAFIRYATARARLEAHYESRIAHLERTINRMVTTCELTDAQRADLIGCVHGTSGEKRSVPLKTLTDVERAFIDTYRTFDAPRRNVLRAVFHLLQIDFERAPAPAVQAEQ